MKSKSNRHSERIPRNTASGGANESKNILATLPIEDSSRPLQRGVFNLLFTRTTGKCLLCCMALSVFCAIAPVFGDDRKVLDDLYNEIMSTSVQEQGALDSGASKPAPVDRLKISPVADPNSEKLRQEIEKMVEEAKSRHSDAVKFMQESR